MPSNKNPEYAHIIIERIRKIMELADLDIPGFAELLGKSAPHIYGILNGSRELSDILAREIGKQLEFDGSKIFNINSAIPANIYRSKNLANFRTENKGNSEYFLSLKSRRSIHTFIKDVLVKSTCFDDGYKYLREITEFCSIELGREFIGDELSKGLQYATKTGILKSTKKKIRKKNGELGTRMVDVYSKK